MELHYPPLTLRDEEESDASDDSEEQPFQTKGTEVPESEKFFVTLASVLTEPVREVRHDPRSEDFRLDCLLFAAALR